MIPTNRRTSTSIGRVVAEALITLGVVLLLFVGYELYATGWATDRAQQAAGSQLTETWQRGETVAPAAGSPVARLHIPRFGAGWSRVVLEGTDQAVLADGPGHYVGTALPGQLGNFAVAGHRVSNGAPFEPADSLAACDPIVVEGRDAWWVYRVLPCGPPVDGVPGTEIVDPTEVDVIAAVPHAPTVTPTVALLTLTTCHPRFSARQRLIVHAALARTADKSGPPPAELGER